MRRLGPDRFEALRSGNFEVGPTGSGGGGGPSATFVFQKGAIQHNPVYHYRPTKADLRRDGRIIWEEMKRQAQMDSVKLGK